MVSKVILLSRVLEWMELALGGSNRTVEVIPYFQKGLCSNGSFTCTGVMGAVKNMTADIGVQRGVLQVRKPGLLFTCGEAVRS